MRHIDSEYGQACNNLELTEEEMKALEPWLLKLGIRCRMTQMHWEAGQRMITIQAENPYRAWADDRCAQRAIRDLTPDAIARYKR